jgi:hypothetical protein
VDGVQVEGWEFRSFMNNPGHGDQISWSGMLFAGTIDYLSTYGKEIAYNVHKQDWGLWREFSASGGGNIATTPSKGKVVGEELVLDKGKTDVANVTVGLKWLSGGVSKQNSANLLNMGLRRFTPRNVPRNNGEIKPRVQNGWAKLNENYGLVGQMVYSTFNGQSVFWQGFYPGDIQALDGHYVIRGSTEHQTMAFEGIAVIASEITKPAQVVGKSLGAGVNLTKSQLKSISSLESQITKHQTKLAEYIKDPMKFDNKGFLKNAPNDEVRQKIIQSRIDHLNQEIQTFQNNIQKILNAQ